MAGNAINWKKISQGPLKGTRVYLNKDAVSAFLQQNRIQVQGSFQQLVTQGDSWALGILDMVDAAPKGMAKRGAAQAAPVTPVAQPTTAARTAAPTTPAAPTATNYTVGTVPPAITAPGATKTLTYEEASKVYEVGVRSQRPRADGEAGLASVYDAMGYHAKPEIQTKAQMDRHVANGETQVFRGTVGQSQDLDIFNKAFRGNANHFAGYGIYGNGTYVAVNQKVADGYAGGKGSGMILRMTIKKGAKIGDYETIEADRAAQQKARMAAHKPLFDERDRLQKAVLSTPRTDPTYAAKNTALNAHDALIQRTVPLGIYDDVGAYAATRGFDGYVVRRTATTGGDYYVILNRGAVRVQDTSIEPSL